MKKLNKLFAILVAMAMVLSLSVIAAFAEENPMKDKAPKIYLSKQLNIAQGITTPENTKFSFEVAKESEDGDTPTNAMPTLSFNDIDMSSMTDVDADGYIVKNSVLDLTTATFPHAGVYKYSVKETRGNIEGMTYDYTTTYYFQVAVDKGGNKTVVVTDKDGKKLDASEPTKDKDENDEGKSDALIQNTYTKTADDTTTPSGTSVSFYVVKETTGKYGDVAKEFPFTITITYPASGDTTNVKYWKYDKDATGTKAAEIDASKVATADGKVTVSVDLASADEFYVTGAPIGTTYTVGETLGGDEASKKYTPSYKVSEGAVESTTNVLAKDTANQGASKTTANVLVKEKAESATANKNAVEWTNENTKDAGDEDPGTTGILVSNLPYIALALVAIGGLVAYVVVRRKADDEA